MLLLAACLCYSSILIGAMATKANIFIDLLVQHGILDEKSWVLLKLDEDRLQNQSYVCIASTIYESDLFFHLIFDFFL